MGTNAAILLAGGLGTRVGGAIPKQFLPLGKKMVFEHSFDVIVESGLFSQIIVVCAKEFRRHFVRYSVIFAEGGKERQESFENGFLAIKTPCDIVVTHDAARPFATQDMFISVIRAAKECGAATVGVPVRYTVKETDERAFIQKTLPRDRIYEIQTPQALSYEIAAAGLAAAKDQKITITDDMGLAELLMKPARVIPGSYRNIKITTKEDVEYSSYLCATNSR